MWWWCLLTAAAAALSAPAPTSGRAVNISNAWVLPQEGFPVFYRYFRDRISWYEADAVCQFHHANLVTVDTTAQYDAVRAYLKELDISSGVWLGLIRSAAGGSDGGGGGTAGSHFIWTDYRPLSGDGYWSSPPEGDEALAPLCAVADPVADYRWTARGCGGPTVASFICELPVPRWALGDSGCMVAALPALTAVYLPERGAVQLSADCGLAGVNSVLCLPDQNHRDLVRKLSCGEVEAYESNSSSSLPPITVPSSGDVATSTTPLDVGRRIPTIAPRSALSTLAVARTRVLINDNLQSNEISQLAREEDTRVMDVDDAQLKFMHEEVARHGDFETIFTQPTDRFVPPLVMAKSKIGDDMKALSPDEKLAQRMADQRNSTQEAHNGAITLENDLKPAPLQTEIDGTVASNELVRESNEQKYLRTKSSKSSVPKKYNLQHKHQKIYLLKSTPSGRREQKTTEVVSFEATRENMTLATDQLETESSSIASIEVRNITPAAEPGHTHSDETTQTNIKYVTQLLSNSTILAVDASAITRELEPISTMTSTQHPLDSAVETTSSADFVTIATDSDADSSVSNTIQQMHSTSAFSAMTTAKEMAEMEENNVDVVTVEPLSLEVGVWETRADELRRPGRTRSRRLQELASRSARKFNPFRILG